MQQTLSPARDFHAVPKRPARRLPRVIALRDIRDVEGLVISTLERLALPVEGEHSDRLVRAGVEAVFRVDRSVPRDHPLAPVLDGMLEQRMLELHESEDRQDTIRLRAA
jgi:hypothetical protein